MAALKSNQRDSKLPRQSKVEDHMTKENLGRKTNRKVSQMKRVGSPMEHRRTNISKMSIIGRPSTEMSNRPMRKDSRIAVRQSYMQRVTTISQERLVEHEEIKKKIESDHLLVTLSSSVKLITTSQSKSTTAITENSSLKLSDNSSPKLISSRSKSTTIQTKSTTDKNYR